MAENGPVIVDAISGVTGAGKSCNARTHFCSADENLEAYGVGKHRHTPEIEQILGLTDRVVFTPHLAPLKRGLLSTVTMPLTPQAIDTLTLEDVVDHYKQFYAGRTFARVLDAGQQPKTASVVGTNAAQIGLALNKCAGVWWRRAPSTICARALRPTSSAPISSLALTSDEACPQWRARCSTFDC
ncbi:MAG: Asd/ArgC dimerization domain-containing protein [Collinsella sp.]